MPLGHERPLAQRHLGEGVVASPRYLLPASVVPCTIIGAFAAAGLRSLHRPAANRFTELRYRPSTVAPDGVDENQVTSTGRYRLMVVENPPVSGPAALTFPHLGDAPVRRVAALGQGSLDQRGWALLRNEEVGRRHAGADVPATLWKNAWSRACAVPYLAAG